MAEDSVNWKGWARSVTLEYLQEWQRELEEADELGSPRYHSICDVVYRLEQQAEEEADHDHPE